MNIVFIGMRGAGKTTIGKAVAKKLSRQFVEMDDLVAKKADMPIAAIVEKHGWDYFRDLESRVVIHVGNLDNIVIATGGGVVERPENTNALKRRSKIVLLLGGVDTLVSRIGRDSKRPLLTGAKNMREDIQAVLQKRDKLYNDAADIIIDTENKTIDQVVLEVLQRINLV